MYSSESAMLVVVAGGERAEAILLLSGKFSFSEDDKASAAFLFLVRGGMMNALSASGRGRGKSDRQWQHYQLGRLPNTAMSLRLEHVRSETVLKCTIDKSRKANNSFLSVLLYS